ncbi:flagellar motor switch protein FliG [Actibacterium sp. XHP0104]|uniref:flagellar motor switch protein FliG n=1 Tax=Actibacterium sp. XHP0104 TaxID=2984335 RepID=UPI0021E905CC|nr:FliG C-terminal domain-containing protein [Actibacterium sp. XHP0104]MCV2880920.1 flagellar motor switch protein FliG [Actibacterium sp. XHP0104]
MTAQPLTSPPATRGLPARAPFSRRRKAAIIVRLLLGEGASLPLGDMPEDMQAALTAEIGAMRYIDGDTLRAVVAEFLEELERIGLSFPGGIEGALELLEGHISTTAASGLRRSDARAAPDPWARISAQDTAALVPLLDAESTEVAAILLSKLPTAKAAELLGLLPGDQARRIACAVSQTATVPPEMVARIGRVLAEQMDAAPPRAFDTPPGARMGAILNLAPAATRDGLLAGLDEDDSAFAETVRRAIFTFADIPSRIEPRDVPNVTRGVDPNDLITALAGAQAAGLTETAEFILSNMSRRMADQLREEMAERGTPRPADTEAAMTQVIAAIRTLETSGELTLIQPEEEPT